MTNSDTGRLLAIASGKGGVGKTVLAIGLAQALAQAGQRVLLVLPAGLDPAEAAETEQAFRALGARHLLPTRLDATRRLGGVLAAAAAGLALTEAGLGQDPAGDLAPIDPAWLAARLLRVAKVEA